MKIVFLLIISCALTVMGYAQTGSRYDGLPQTLSLQGFPQLGYPSALVMDGQVLGDTAAESAGIVMPCDRGQVGPRVYAGVARRLGHTIAFTHRRPRRPGPKLL